MSDWICSKSGLSLTSDGTNKFSLYFATATDCTTTSTHLSMSDCTSWLAYSSSISYSSSTSTTYSTQISLPSDAAGAGVVFKSLSNQSPTAITITFRGFGGACTSSCARPSDPMTFSTCATYTDPSSLLTTYNSQTFSASKHKAFSVDSSCVVKSVTYNMATECTAAMQVVTLLGYYIFVIDGEQVANTTGSARRLGCDEEFNLWTRSSCSSYSVASGNTLTSYSGKTNAKALAVDATDTSCSSNTNTSLVSGQSKDACSVMLFTTAYHTAKRTSALGSLTHAALWAVNDTYSTSSPYITTDPCSGVSCGFAICTWCCNNVAACSDCPRGYTGTAPCTACSAGTYKATTGSTACTSCPANSNSPTASTSITSCTCNSDYTGTIVNTSSVCTVVSTSFSVTMSTSLSATASPTLSVSATRSVSGSPSVSATTSTSTSASVSATATISASSSSSAISSMSVTRSITDSSSVSVTPSISATTSISVTSSASTASSVSASQSISATATVSSSQSASATPSISATTSGPTSVSSSLSATPSTSISTSSSMSVTSTATMSVSASASPSMSASSPQSPTPSLSTSQAASESSSAPLSTTPLPVSISSTPTSASTSATSSASTASSESATSTTSTSNPTSSSASSPSNSVSASESAQAAITIHASPAIIFQTVSMAVSTSTTLAPTISTSAPVQTQTQTQTASPSNSPCNSSHHDLEDQPSQSCCPCNCEQCSTTRSLHSSRSECVDHGHHSVESQFTARLQRMLLDHEAQIKRLKLMVQKLQQQLPCNCTQ